MQKIIKKIILLNKKEGETPLQALEYFRFKHKEYEKIPMTYAGRLDPMASGLLLILAGEETKNKEKYLHMDKEYDFSILFGFSTDTYDILGKVVDSKNFNISEIGLRKNIIQILPSFLGNRIQKYPIYSSKTVLGVPLFLYARNSKEVEIPEKEVCIKSLKLIKIKKLNKEKLLESIEKSINKVQGDFRQKEIIKIWKKELSRKKSSTGFFTASFKIKCTSGTYVRSISNEMGEKLGIPALAFSIKRTKVGRFSLP